MTEWLTEYKLLEAGAKVKDLAIFHEKTEE